MGLKEIISAGMILNLVNCTTLQIQSVPHRKQIGTCKEVVVDNCKTKSPVNYSKPPQNNLDDKTPVTIYFEPNCYHCHNFFDWLKEDKIEENYSRKFKFEKICVELPYFGEEGRCYQLNGQDGKSNYEKLEERCKKEGSKDCGGAPTIFVGNKYIVDTQELLHLLRNK